MPAGPETGNADADPPEKRGRPTPMGQHERTGLIESAGVVATACRQRRPVATREIPTAVYGQPATRESQAGPCGVAERSVLPMKPGNAGGGKGPQLRASAQSDQGPRDWR